MLDIADLVDVGLSLRIRKLLVIGPWVQGVMVDSLDLIACKPTCPLVQAWMSASKGSHGRHHTGLAALLGRQKRILILKLSLILEKIEKFLEDWELTPTQVSAVEAFIIFNYSLPEVSRA